MLGGDCLDDLDVLRGDPGTIAIFGVKNIIAPRTAGDFLRRFQIGDLCDFQRALRTIAERVRPRQTSEICTIDLDASILKISQRIPLPYMSQKKSCHCLRHNVAAAPMPKAASFEYEASSD
jgi:hypothetical protein